MIEIRSEGNVLYFKGRFDAAQVEHAEAAFNASSGPTTVDFSELEYLSSAGIAVLVRAYKRLHGIGHPLVLRNVSAPIRDVLRFSGLDKILLVE
jgi:anti-anti-sigma factor